MFLKDRVIVVEDDEVFSSCLRRDITALGYNVVATVSTGQEAIDAAFGKKPDLILMDIHLIGSLNGIEAAKQIRKKMDIPIIYATAETENKVLDKIMATEPAGLLTKPFEIDDLRSAIQVALNVYQPRRAITDQNIDTINLSVLSDSATYERIKHALRNVNEIVVVDARYLPKGLINEINGKHPQVVLIDGNFFENDHDFLNLIAVLKSKKKNTKILAILSNKKQDLKVQSISLGVSGFVYEEMSRSDFIKSIYTVYKDGTWFEKYDMMSFLEQSIRTDPDLNITQQLSEKEKEVAMLASKGRSNKQIARELYISENTVKSHLKNVYKKLGVSGRKELIVSFQN